MATSTSLSGRTSAPKPPAKGSFPLDHLGECKLFAVAYERCLDENGRAAGRCREQARKYLKCRMDAGLMAQEEWKKLGLEHDRPVGGQGDGAQGGKDGNADEERAEQKGFVAGVRTAKRRKDRYNKSENDLDKSSSSHGSK